MILAAVYDRATQAHGPVMTFRTNGEAIRSFAQEAKNAQGQISKSAPDFELWKLADYNEETGDITSNRERLSRAEDYTQGA